MVRMSIDMEKIRTTMIVYGNVQRSDYRGRVISMAKMMNITGTIQNLSDGTVKIIEEGEKINIERFYDEIDIKNFLIKVTKIERKEDSEPIGEYESFYKLVGEGETDERLDTAAELLKQLIIVTKDGFATLDENTTNGFNKVGEKIEILREDTNQNFQRMDEKYSKLSEAMFAIVEKIEERNQIFEERIEKTNKNIELLLNILVKQK